MVDTRKERIDEVLQGRTRTLTVVLDRIEDTFNMAAVLRTCEGLGVQEVHVIRNAKFAWRPNAKVTQGCDKWLDVKEYEDFAACLAHLKSRGFTVLASGFTEGATNLFDLKFNEKLALVFGNERAGVSDEVLKTADGVFWIPMRGFVQSFNISVAVAATLSRAMSWRREHGLPAGDLTPEEHADLKARFTFLSVKQRRKIYKDAAP
ncbi:MAG: TrmH family RNA methyltransferase [Myxococcaceae bacterium]